MEFGKVHVNALSEINFTLPPDVAEAQNLLHGIKNRSVELYVGCAKWGRPEWVGKIYPKGTKATNFLDQYITQFNSIELNATFYNYPDKKNVMAWVQKTQGYNFKFCPKFTNTISHLKRLKNAYDETNKFLEGVSYFGDTLGPCFLQLHDNFGPKNFADIENYLAALPKDFNVFLEVRNPEWFTNEQAKRNLFILLKQLNIGWIITDASGRRDCVHMQLPTPSAFVRFVGNSLHPTDYTRVNDWVSRMQIWIDAGIDKVYFFMHQHEEAYSPELCKYVIEQLNAKCAVQLRVPEFVK